MAFGGLGSSGSGPMAEINTTPLVDVMLVLLIIFILTAPLLTHKVTVQLPQTGGVTAPLEPDTIALTVDAQGAYRWNGDAITLEELQARFATLATQQPQPEVQLLADQATRYEHLARALSIAQAAGVQRVGFVMQPAGKP